jgi:hypothetical protein
MGTKPFMYSIYIALKMSLEKTIETYNKNKYAHSIHNLTLGTLGNVLTTQKRSLFAQLC